MTAKAGSSTPSKLTVYTTTEFRKDLKKAPKNKKCDLKVLKEVMGLIEDRKTLPQQFKDHALQGRYPRKKGSTDCRECHVCNDWLLVYRIEGDRVDFIRTGTHSELFK